MPFKILSRILALSLRLKEAHKEIVRTEFESRGINGEKLCVSFVTRKCRKALKCVSIAMRCGTECLAVRKKDELLLKETDMIMLGREKERRTSSKGDRHDNASKHPMN